MTRLSWRDPDGQVFRQGNNIYRLVHQVRRADLEELLKEPWYKQRVVRGDVVDSEFCEPPVSLATLPKAGGFWVQHESLARPAYPHEITALQLWHSAMLTIDLALEALQSGWTLKDASAWNVLHVAGRACFIDVLSFSRHDGSAIWPSYAQFMRHFLIPLILHRHMGLEPSELFTMRRDGMQPESAMRLLPWHALLRLSVLEAIALPSWLSGYARRNAVLQNQNQRRMLGGRRVLHQTLQRLKSHLVAIRPSSDQMKTVWSGYESDRAHYADADLVIKRQLVKDALLLARPCRVLDLGCNAGEFSQLAVSMGASEVVAADFDTGALTRLHERVQQSKEPINAMVFNVARPTPAVGWRNREVPSALDRLRGQVDLIMALGLLHHLLVSERIPLDEVPALISELEATWLLLEWIPPQDPRFREIAGANHALYQQLVAADLERCFEANFELVSRFTIGDGPRVLYLWRRRAR